MVDIPDRTRLRNDGAESTWRYPGGLSLGVYLKCSWTGLDGGVTVHAVLGHRRNQQNSVCRMNRLLNSEGTTNVRIRWQHSDSNRHTEINRSSIPATCTTAIPYRVSPVSSAARTSGRGPSKTWAGTAAGSLPCTGPRWPS